MPNIVKLTVLGLALFVAITSLLPFLRREAWWIRIFDFPRLQMLFLALLSSALTPCYYDPGSWQGLALLGAAASAALIQTVCIIPYTPLARKEVQPAGDSDPDSTISLLVANVLMDNRSTQRLLRMVSEFAPDIVLLLEPNRWWEEQMRVLEESGYRHTVKEPLDNKYGMLLYSRLELLSTEIRHLLRQEIPSMHVQVRLRSGAVVWLHGLHPEPPSPSEADTSLPRDAELLMVGREAKEHDLPTIVAGDLNDVAWSHTTRLFQKVSGLLDPRKGRGMFNTFHAKIPFMRWPLDHVFHSEHFFLCDMQRLPFFGSDHFPVYLRLLLHPVADEVHEPPSADQEESETANEKIAAASQRPH